MTKQFTYTANQYAKELQTDYIEYSNKDYTIQEIKEMHDIKDNEIYTVDSMLRVIKVDSLDKAIDLLNDYSDKHDDYEVGDLANFLYGLSLGLDIETIMLEHVAQEVEWQDLEVDKDDYITMQLDTFKELINDELKNYKEVIPVLKQAIKGS